MLHDDLCHPSLNALLFMISSNLPELGFIKHFCDKKRCFQAPAFRSGGSGPPGAYKDAGEESGRETPATLRRG